MKCLCAATLSLVAGVLAVAANAAEPYNGFANPTRLPATNQFADAFGTGSSEVAPASCQQCQPGYLGSALGGQTQGGTPGSQVSGASYGTPVYGGSAYGTSTYGGNGYGGNSYGGNGYGGNSYGGNSYGGNSYGGNSYGGNSYGGNSYGGGAFGGQSVASQPYGSAVTTTQSYAPPTAAGATRVANGAAQGPVLDGAAGAVGPVHGGAGYLNASPYFQAMTSPCGECAPVCAPPVKPCPTWFGGIYGLIMDRADDDEKVFLMDPQVPSRTYASSLDAEMNTAGGFEARIGRTFGCCCGGLELVYWGLFPSDESATTTLASTPAPWVYTTIDYNHVWLDFYDPMTMTATRDSIHNAYNVPQTIQAVQLQRSFEYHNVEINFLSGQLFASPCCTRGGCGGGGGCGAGLLGHGGYGLGLGAASYAAGSAVCGPACAPPVCQPEPRLSVGWLAGVRYFRADEGAFLAYDANDGVIDYASPNTEFFHDVETENNLVGMQVGLNVDYCLTKCFTLDIGTSAGVYNNHVNQYQRIYNGNGPAYVDPAAPQEYTIRNSDDELAFLGELRAGVAWRFCKCARLAGGYRVFGISGAALPLDQLHYGRTGGDLNHVGHINANGSLILHGAYAGAEFAW